MLLFVMPMSVYTLLVFIEGSDFLGMNVRSAENMLAGTAITPHVYRQMVPLIARGVIAATPISVSESAAESLREWLMQPRSLLNRMVGFRHAAMPPELAVHNLYPILVLSLIDYFFLLGFLYCVWRLSRELFPDMFSVRIMAPVFAVCAIPPFCARFAYIYDFPVLFFSAWLTLLLLRQRLGLYTLAAIVATLNKETTLYFLAVFLLYGSQKIERRQWIFHAMLQLVGIVGIKGAVTLLYSENPGEFLWTRGLYDHLLTSMDGYPVYSYLGLALATLLIGHDWRGLPYLLKCWVALVPLSVLSWLIFGMRNEYRVMYEVFPALIVCSCYNIARINRWHSPRTQGFQGS